MPSFLIYDANGVILGVYTYLHCDPETVKPLNTPDGMTALDVEDGHEVILDQTNWTVKEGELVALNASAGQAASQLRTVAFHENQLSS